VKLRNLGFPYVCAVGWFVATSILATAWMPHTTLGTWPVRVLPLLFTWTMAPPLGGAPTSIEIVDGGIRITGFWRAATMRLPLSAISIESSTFSMLGRMRRLRLLGDDGQYVEVEALPHRCTKFVEHLLRASRQSMVSVQTKPWRSRSVRPFVEAVGGSGAAIALGVAEPSLSMDGRYAVLTLGCATIWGLFHYRRLQATNRLLNWSDEKQAFVSAANPSVIAGTVAPGQRELLAIALRVKRERALTQRP